MRPACRLVKLLGADGRERYLSMLRLDGLDAMAHDGWQIVRELIGGPPATGAEGVAGEGGGAEGGGGCGGGEGGGGLGAMMSV